MKNYISGLYLIEYENCISRVNGNICDLKKIIYDFRHIVYLILTRIIYTIRKLYLPQKRLCRCWCDTCCWLCCCWCRPHHLSKMVYVSHTHSLSSPESESSPPLDESLTLNTMHGVASEADDTEGDATGRLRFLDGGLWQSSGKA